MKLSASYLLPVAVLLAISHSSTKSFAASEAHEKSTKTSNKQLQDAENQAEEILAELEAGTSDPGADNYIGQPPASGRQSTLSPQSGPSSVHDRPVKGGHRNPALFIAEMRQYQMQSNTLRNFAEVKLQTLGPSIAPCLARHLSSPSQLVASACANVLIKFGPVSISPILRELKATGSNPFTQTALTQIGGDVLAPLVRMLRSPEDADRLAAADVINNIVPTLLNQSYFESEQTNVLVPSADLVDAICAVSIGEKLVKVRRLDTLILGKIGPRQKVMETLYKLAEADSEPTVRGTAICAIGTIVQTQSDQGAASSVTKLVRCAKEDEFDGCRLAAINALSQARKAPDTTIPALISLLNDPRTDIVEATLTCLQAFESKASPALPALTRIVEENTNSHQSTLALATIGRMGIYAKPALELILTDTVSSDDQLKYGALQALRSLATDLDLKPFIPKLSALLKSSDTSTRGEAMGVLEAMGPQAISARDDLLKCMKTFPNDASRAETALRTIVGHYP